MRKFKKVILFILLIIGSNKRIGIKYFEIKEYIRVQRAIYKKEEVIFTNVNIKNIMDAFNVKTKDCGIGWKVVY